MTAYLGLGSNQGDRQALIERAVALLETHVGKVTACSSFIETEPWGFDSPHPFLNAVVSLTTDLTPIALLDETQHIERQLGRRTKSRNGHYADRPIDIDILLLDDKIINTSRLTVPHPLLLQREFAWRPLLELAPDIHWPQTGEPLSTLVSEH